jgi:hydroxyethylthiazole kinase-like uncharacterized protein yjeF
MEHDAISEAGSSRPIHTVEGIRAIEARFLPGAEPPLMERAGAAVAEQARAIIGAKSGEIVLLAGPGNNGGDAFVAARLLRAAGHRVTVVFAGDPARLPEDARNAHGALLAAGGATVAELPTATEWVALAVDGLFGIGLGRPLEGRYAAWVAWLNGLSCPVLAIDIPSGLDADTGRILGCAVRASHTATFIALKPGLLTLDGPDHCGQIVVHDIGLPLGEFPAAGRTLAADLFADCLRPRPRNSHKGSWGDVGVVGGAAGMVGAALLAGRAALRLGAGRVFVGLLAPEALAVDPVQPELMLRPARQVVDIASVLAVGPGLGQSGDAHDLLADALRRAVPLVLDADALNLLAAHPVLAGLCARREAPVVVTPHPAEASRLLGKATADIQADRVAAACEIARRLKCVAVLKGCGSVVAQPDGRWFINGTGNPGMASAGMGDVLTGLVASLLAQGWPPRTVLLAAVQLHGAAGDLLAERGEGPVGLAAGELIDPARRLFNRWVAGAENPGSI